MERDVAALLRELQQVEDTIKSEAFVYVRRMCPPPFPARSYLPI